MFVYTILDNRLYRVYSRLSNRLYNPVSQPVERTVAVRSTRLNEQWLFVQHGCQTGYQTGCTTGLTTVLNEQLFVQHVVKPVDNRLYRVYEHSTGCQTSLTTGSG